MNANKAASAQKFGSDLQRVDAHVIGAHEYEELPELTDDMLATAVVNKGGRPHAVNPKRLLSLRLPEDVIAKWRLTGRGWQSRMAQRLAEPGT